MGTHVSRVSALAQAIRDKFNAVTPRLQPPGGTAGQVLTKVDANDFNAAWASPAAGGTDPWTYVKLGSAALTTGTASIDTALAIAPLANAVHVVEGQLFLQSAATTTGVQVGLKFPTGGVLQSIGWVIVPTSASASVNRFWGSTAAAKAAATAVQVANEGFYGKVEATLVTGSNPAGNLIVTLASEVAGSEVRIMPNSWLRWRTI